MAINIVIGLFFYCHIVAMDFGVLAAMVQADRIFKCVFYNQSDKQ